MNFKLLNNKCIKQRKNNQGTTLVEMIVCFALLGIFMACAAALISNIASIYYSIKGEIYSKEVSDIVMTKIVSEIDGAEYFKDSTLGGINPEVADDHSSISLYDKTDTYVRLGMKAGKGLEVYYYDIVFQNNGVRDNYRSRVNTSWYFDSSVYGDFEITDLKFYRGGDSFDKEDKKNYNISDISLSDYGNNVILVLMKMKSGKYGVYEYRRFVRMYNVPESE